MTGRRGSTCTLVTASRAEARMNAFLKLGCAKDSSAQNKRVSSCTPETSISRYPEMHPPRPTPPHQKTGTSLTTSRAERTGRKGGGSTGSVRGGGENRKQKKK